ncbi:MAG: Ig-like domain-containing protein [Gemmataceae bacterium]|nr:Ig-like domain-containing protein [Gemmataceae bacterium]
MFGHLWKRRTTRDHTTRRPNQRFRVRPGVETLEDRCVPSGNPPVAVADSFSILHDLQLIASPLDNDSDPENDLLTPEIVNPPTYGHATFNPDGSLSYWPTGNWVGTDQMTYRVHDGTSYSNTVTITFDVTNQAPTAIDLGPYTVGEGKWLPLDLVGGASDPDGDPLTVEITQYPTYSFVSYDETLDLFVYQSEGEYQGQDNFQYRVFDGVAYSSVVTVAINVVAFLERTVTNTNNAGPGSLRAAIADVNDAGVAGWIDFAPYVQGTITLDSELEELGNITIVGPGSNVLTITRNPQAQANFGIFYVTSDPLGQDTYTASIQGLTLSGGTGWGQGGGALVNWGHTTLVDVVFSGNQARWGGAIENKNRLTASNCRFTENTATESDGGAIYNQGTRLSLTNCQIGYENTAARDGGGIYNHTGSNLQIRNNTQIFANTAGHQGGGIFNRGTVRMLSGYIGLNEANQASGQPGSGRGGGYYQAGGSAIFRGVNFDRNNATDRGGGFYLAAGSLGFQDACTISGNTSPNGPGGYRALGSTWWDPVNCTINDIILVET